MKHHLHKFDTFIGQLITSLPKWLRLPMAFISFLGQPVITVGLAMFIIGIGFKTTNEALLIAGIVTIATTVVSSLLKMILRRNRPITEYVDRMFFHTFSFPSGHAAGTVPIFGLIAYLLLHLGQPWSLAAAITVGLLPVLVGVSRVYLGAHYASDVVGGWIIGIAGLAVIVFILQPTL